MANDEAGSIAAAPEFWKRIDRPNIFIKIPGTAEGVPAIEESIAAGINVNVTLLFSLERYDEIHWAFIRGLERRVEAGQPIDDVHSVASFFVSRVDTAVDKQLPRGLAAGGQGRGRQRQAGLPALPRDHGERPLEGARGRRRARAAAAVGVHRHQEPGLLGRALRRHADRPRLRQHDARPDHRGVLDHGTVARTVDADLDEARQALAAVAAAGSRSTRSPTSSRWTASRRSPSRSTRCSGRSRSGWGPSRERGAA